MIKHQKKLGQNFLINVDCINKIIRAINPIYNDNLIEIGPGIGALTAPLLQDQFHVTAIEIDDRLPVILKNLPNAQSHLSLILQDVLQVDFNKFKFPMRIFGNLPYNIATPLIINLFKFIDSIKDMHFMLQKEVADRIVSLPGSRDYGRLSIIVQYYCQSTLLFYVTADNFDPPPKVESAVIRLVPYKKSPFIDVDPEKLFFIVSKAFAMRRKTLLNNLKTLISKQELIDLAIDPGLRPENLSIDDYINITNYLHK